LVANFGVGLAQSARGIIGGHYNDDFFVSIHSFSKTMGTRLQMKARHSIRAKIVPKVIKNEKDKVDGGVWAYFGSIATLVSSQKLENRNSKQVQNPSGQADGSRVRFPIQSIIMTGSKSQT